MKNINRLFVAILLTATPLLSSTSVLAIPTPPATPNDVIRKSLETDLLHRKNTSFASLLVQWETQHGVKAFLPLLQIAKDIRRPDSDRYIATMAAAKIGGKTTASRLAPLLNDKSWMVRSAGIRAISAFRDHDSGALILPLLHDKALVIRSEAVQAVRTLRPAGGAQALIDALKNQENYQLGKALWLPHDILDALVAMGAREQAHALRPLLRHDRDPELQRRTIATLQALTGKNPKSGRSLRDQARAWEKAI